MKVLFYYPYTLAGEQGAANGVRGLGVGLARLGVEVTFAIDSAAPQTIDDPPGCKVARVPHLLRGRLSLPRRLRHLTRQTDLLHLTSCWVAGKIAAAVDAERRDVPYVVCPQGALDPFVLRRSPLKKRLWGMLLERPHLRHAFALHLLFAEEARGAELLGVRIPTIVAPNGLEPPARPIWDGGSGGYILWIGRFDIECKGLDLLVHAVASLPVRDRVPLRLHGVDYRGGRRTLEGFIDAAGVRRWISVGDPVYGEAKTDLMARAAGFVYPSRWDAGAVSALEALALGVPTAVTPYPCGGFLGAEGAAVLVEPTASSIAKGLCTLVSPTAAAIATRGSDVVRRHFAWSAVAQSWLHQVETLLAVRAGGIGRDASA
jgi:glycosyltransferase involved in cell wall biosynthesis